MRSGCVLPSARPGRESPAAPKPVVLSQTWLTSATSAGTGRAAGGWLHLLHVVDIRWFSSLGARICAFGKAVAKHTDGRCSGTGRGRHAMSQRAVENLLGRLLTDAEFRRRFFQEPAARCGQEILDVSGREIEAVLAVAQVEFEQFAKQLDPRIVRAAVRKDFGLSRIRKGGVEPRSGRFGAAK
jgi:hypothetical protein